jgi:hypothetical protein
MTDLYHPLYWVGSAAFMLAGGLIGYSIGFRGGWARGVEAAARKAEFFAPEMGDLIRALKGGRP